jgi:predicted lipoprotein
LYTAHEVTLATGTVVREFATTDGTVFAVVWRGPVLPDLKSQLGSYAAIFENEAAQARLNGKRGGSIAVNLDGLVMSSGVRMRAFFGHAYLPALVPANLNIQDVLQ